MSDVTQQEIVEALERAQALKEMSEEFINVAGSINDAVESRLEEERGIDIDSNRWIPLDDIPYGEEVIRVKDELPNVESAISTLEFIAEGKVSTAELGEKFEEVNDDLDMLSDWGTISTSLVDSGHNRRMISVEHSGYIMQGITLLVPVPDNRFLFRRVVNPSSSFHGNAPLD